MDSKYEQTAFRDSGPGIFLRRFGGVPKPLRLKVTLVTADRIICAGDWEFDRQTGAEIDEDLGRGPVVLPVPLSNQNQNNEQPEPLQTCSVAADDV